MRIIEGKFKGKIISYKEQKGTRVTSEKVRKAVFDVLKNIAGDPSAPLDKARGKPLGTNLSGLKVADIFCGSGMYGIEALSRGAEEVWFVDESKYVINSLKRNIKRLGEKELSFVRLRLITQSVKKFIKICDDKFDLVFADPPYFPRQYGGTSDFNLDEFDKIHKILEKEGIFVLEYSGRVKVGDFFGLKKLVEKKYGDSKIAIFGRK